MDESSDASRVRVLIVGDSADDNVCDVYRSRMFVPALRQLGVDVRYSLPSIPDDEPLGRDEWERRSAAGIDRLIAEAEEADVIVFRRGYVTHILCFDCDFATLDPGAAAAHIGATRHTVNAGPNLAVRRFFELLETDAGVARRRAIIYETDDDWLRIEPTNGQKRSFQHERDLIERMIRRADLVTVSTPILARRLAPLATDVRVIRNAVDPAWYGEPPIDAAPAGVEDGQDPRVLFYGSIGRLRDYAVCSSAVDAIARRGARRVWFGAPSLDSEVARVAHNFDEVHSYVTGVPGFARYLHGLRPAIGLAPLSGSSFDRAKSELHWLEYSMVGAVTVATSMPGGGPYEVIRSGVDGFLVGSRAEWKRVLARLAGSPALRAEVAAQARARVTAEYGVGVRALEWATTYRSAVANTGRGFGRRPSGVEPAARNGLAGSGPFRANRAPRPGSGGARRSAAVLPAVGGGAPAASPPTAILEAYVAAQAFAHRSPLRLLLGAGGSSVEAAVGRPSGEGWIRIDTDGQPDLRHDVGFGLPFADGAIEAIEACHVLDRLGDLAAILVGEAVRVLRPGGTLCIVAADRAVALARQRALHLEGVILVGRSARLPAFTAEMLERLLVQAGFARVVRGQAGEGEIVIEATR